MTLWIIVGAIVLIGWAVALAVMAGGRWNE